MVTIPQQNGGKEGRHAPDVVPRDRSTAPAFLVVSLRYLGDVLLATPLALSIKEHVPEARVDFLVFAGTEGILAKNPLVDRIHIVPPGSKNPRLAARVFRQYDYAIGTSASDRTTILTAIAGRTSIGFSHFRLSEWWKKRLLSSCGFYDVTKHVVPLILSQLEPLGITPHPRVVMGFDADDEAFVRLHLGEDRYVLIHPYTRRWYKSWPAPAWGTLATLIRDAGLRPVFTVSPSDTDRVLQEQILTHVPADTTFFHAPYSFSQLAAAIKRSRGFVGVDTVVTHGAAALEVPTVALYGPTPTNHWGPWPNESREHTPYRPTGGVQRIGRITVIQEEFPCVPCNRETCAISQRGRIECLEAIAAEKVFAELRRQMSAVEGEHPYTIRSGPGGQPSGPTPP